VLIVGDEFDLEGRLGGSFASVLVVKDSLSDAGLVN
jgi:hypothetical protein